MENRCLVMGILNATPDSFSDGGKYLDFQAGLNRGLEMFQEGCDIVDIGGQSTRPGADLVPTDVELARVGDLVAELSKHGRVSIDTTNPVVAMRAIEYGASLINDVSATLYELAGSWGVGWVAMHSRGTPKTMSSMTDYKNLVEEVKGFLTQKVDQAVGCGVTEVYIDPGIGFAKTPDQNVEILSKIHEFVATGYPVLIGASRKSFLGTLAQWPQGEPSNPPGDLSARDEASLGVACWCISQGVSVVRVHNVAQAVAAVALGGVVPG